MLSPNAILHDGASETIGPNGFYPFFDRMGMPATGAAIGVTDITIMRVADEKIVESWQNRDMLGMMEQIQGFARSATYLVAPSANAAVGS